MALAQAIFEEYRQDWQRHFAPATQLRLGAVRLAALADQQPGEAHACLNADEMAQWEGFRLKKRRLEWLGGRMAAKWAAAAILGESPAAWPKLAIRTEKDGRPCVAAEAHPAPPFISISHSGPLAAALAANLPCGLDIQQPGDKILRVKECFAGAEEEDILQASLPLSFSETERLTMLWTAKEAMRKMVRITPLLGLLEIRLLASLGGQGTPHNPLALTVTPGRAESSCPAHTTVLCFFTDNLAWAMTCPPARKE